MRNLYYLLYTAILLQSCGFQSRKYTSGYYGRDYQNVPPPKHETISVPKQLNESSQLPEITHDLEPSIHDTISTVKTIENG